MKYLKFSTVWLAAVELERCLREESEEISSSDTHSPDTYVAMQRLVSAWADAQKEPGDVLKVFAVGPLTQSMRVVSQGVRQMVESQTRILPLASQSEMWVAIGCIVEWHKLHPKPEVMRTVGMLLKLQVPPEQIATMVGWKMPSGRGDWNRVLQAEQNPGDLNATVIADQVRMRKHEIIQEWLLEFPAPVSGDIPQAAINAVLAVEIDDDSKVPELTPNIVEAWTNGIEPERFALMLGVPAELCRRVYAAIDRNGSVADGLSPSDPLDALLALARGMGIISRSNKGEVVVSKIREAEKDESQDSGTAQGSAGADGEARGVVGGSGPKAATSGKSGTA